MLHVPLFAFSRGGMLALLASGLVAFWLVPKRPLQMAVIAIAVLVGFRLAGAEVRQKFMTTFAAGEDRDGSAQSRLDLWGQAWETMVSHPLIGIGPRQWGGWARSHYGWTTNKEAHNTWLQLGAEVGFPGLIALLGFFIAPVVLLWPIARGQPDTNPAESDLARMVITGLAGFLVASQFITVYGVEAPYYVAMMGGGLLQLRSVGHANAAESFPSSSPAPLRGGKTAGNGDLPRHHGTVAR